jgi:hypothetical protein
MTFGSSEALLSGAVSKRETREIPRRYESFLRNDRKQQKTKHVTRDRKKKDHILVSQLRKFRQANGMDRDGFLNMSPLMGDMLSQAAMINLPMFHSLPHCVLTSYETSLLVSLQNLENEIVRLVGTKTGEGHKYGANFGVNLGLSVVGGGTHAKKADAISGSVQYSSFIKGKPELRRRLLTILADLLQSAFGKHAWYRRLLHITTKLNKD